GVARSGAEIAEVAARVGGLVVHVARCRLGTRLLPPPRDSVASVVLRERALVVRGVAVREHGAGDGVEQCGGRVVPGRIAQRHVSGDDAAAALLDTIPGTVFPDGDAAY